MNPSREVNIPARRAFAELLRQFHSGRMTNFQFEARVDALHCQLGSDHAVDDIYWANWGTYCDVFQHSVRTRRPQRRIIARWVLFLQTSEQPAALPREPFTWMELARIVLLSTYCLGPLAVFVLGWLQGMAVLMFGAAFVIMLQWLLPAVFMLVRKHAAAEPSPARCADEWSPWPFPDASALRAAGARPVYLAGLSA